MSAKREKRNQLQIKVDGVRRLIMWHFLSDNTPYYQVSEFPKSGGSWVAQMLSAYLKVPFPRNESVSLFERKPCILHGHHKYSSNFKNTIYVLRDGRDCIVSAYFHELVHNDKNPAWAVDRARRRLPFEDYNDVKSNLPEFIKYKFSVYPKGVFRFHWSEFAMSIIERDVNILFYEDLITNTSKAFGKAVERLTGQKQDMHKIRFVCEQFSFANQTNRQPGTEDRSSFLRKGIVGDWKNYFTTESCKFFDRYCGDALIKAGYENDNSWVYQDYQ